MTDLKKKNSKILRPGECSHGYRPGSRSLLAVFSKLRAPFPESQKTIDRGFGLAETLVAIFVISIGVYANLSQFSAVSTSNNRFEARIQLSNLVGSIERALRAKTVILKSAKGALKNCVTASANPNCANNADLKATIYQPGTTKVIVSSSPTYYSKGGIPVTDQKKAAFVATLDSVRPRCPLENGVHTSSCTMAYGIIFNVTVEVVPENYRMLGFTAKSQLFDGGKISDRYRYSNSITTTFSSFKISDKLTTSDCNSSSLYSKTVGGNKVFSSTPSNPKPVRTLVGFENFSADGKTADPICVLASSMVPKPQKGPDGVDGAPGPKGATGPKGADGAKGPRGYRGTTGGVYSGAWAEDPPCCMPSFPKPNYE